MSLPLCRPSPSLFPSKLPSRLLRPQVPRLPTLPLLPLLLRLPRPMPSQNPHRQALRKPPSPPTSRRRSSEPLVSESCVLVSRSFPSILRLVVRKLIKTTIDASYPNSPTSRRLPLPLPSPVLLSSLPPITTNPPNLPNPPPPPNLPPSPLPPLHLPPLNLSTRSRRRRRGREPKSSDLLELPFVFSLRLSSLRQFDMS
jgi:hypothetical protein